MPVFYFLALCYSNSFVFITEVLRYRYINDSKTVAATVFVNATYAAVTVMQRKWTPVTKTNELL